jgi:predicted transposase YdaD
MKLLQSEPGFAGYFIALVSTMKTDKQIFQIFQAQPQWVFLLAGQPSPGGCRFESMTIKAIETHCDGVLVPDAVEEEMTVVEIQGYNDTGIYERLIIEMALVQRQNSGRRVQGIIIFLDESRDPKTEPWTKVVRSISLRESISQVQRTDPHHPLVAVLGPLLIDSDEVLECEAAACYNWIWHSDLPEAVRKTLAEVFINWLEQRFSHKGKLEIEEMLVGQLPDLRETQTGKDLIAIGRAEGKAEGKAEGLLKLLEIRFGEVSGTLREAIQKVDSDQQIDSLYELALKVENLSDFSL